MKKLKKKLVDKIYNKLEENLKCERLFNTPINDKQHFIYKLSLLTQEIYLFKHESLNFCYRINISDIITKKNIYLPISTLKLVLEDLINEKDFLIQIQA